MREPISVLLMALVALVVGICALFSMQSNRKALRRMDERLVLIETRLGVVDKETTRVEGKLDHLLAQTQKALTSAKDGVLSLKDKAAAVGAGRSAVDTQEPPERSSERPAEHKVRAGDALERIARQYSTSVEAILSANPGLDPRRLKIGQRLKLP